MRKWVLKAIVQKAISYFPQREKLNHFFQKHITKGVHLTDLHFGIKLAHASDHFHYYDQYKNTPIENTTVIELGTGWYPIIPISLFLNGFDKIISIDTQSWLTKESMITTLEHFIKWNDEFKLEQYFSKMESQNWEKLLELYENRESLSLNDLCKDLRMEVILQDARKLDFKNESIDFICSNNTFEHIPEKILSDILLEFNRVLKNKGVMSHFIDMTDHFAHFDTSINIFNFLKFSDTSWSRIDNSIQPQNRLRLLDYKKMYDSLDIPITEEKNKDGKMEELESISLDKRFSSYSLSDLVVIHSYLITSKI